MNFKIRRSVNGNQMIKKYINSGEDCSINRLNLKIRFLGQKKKHIKINEMSFSMLLIFVTFCARDNFAGTFVNIRFMIFGQERLACLLIHICKIFNCQGSFKMLLSMWLVIVENDL